jgi:hypothetical protein
MLLKKTAAAENDYQIETFILLSEVRIVQRQLKPIDLISVTANGYFKYTYIIYTYIMVQKSCPVLIV